MKLTYRSDTDSLYIDLAERPGLESREVPEGVVLDYDSSGRLTGTISTMPPTRSNYRN